MERESGYPKIRVYGLNKGFRPHLNNDINQETEKIIKDKALTHHSAIYRIDYFVKVGQKFFTRIIGDKLDEANDAVFVSILSELHYSVMDS